MKLFRWLALAWRVSALVILMAGCATHRPVISTWNESQKVPGRTDKIGLIKQLNPASQTAELGRLLTDELKREGFNVVPTDEADYLMAYSLEDELVPQDRSVTMMEPASPPQTTAQVIDQAGARGYSGDPTLPARPVSQPVVFRSRGIRLFLYNNPKTHPGGFQIVWQGYIAAGQATPKRETALIKTLLGYLGQEHHGAVNLVE